MELHSVTPSGMGGVLTTTGQQAQPASEVVKPAAAPVAAGPGAVQAVAGTSSPEQVKSAVEKINKTVEALGRDLQFTVDEDTKINIVKVVDTKTKDVIRQFPSEEVVAIAKALDKLQGLLVKDKA